MIETNNPEIDVNELMEKVKAEVAKRSKFALAGPQTSQHQIIGDPTSLKLLNIQSLIDNAEARSQVRTKWPDPLNKFPLNVSKKIQNAVLKILNFLFKEQRVVNVSLVQALRESLALNRELIQQIRDLQTNITKIKGQVEGINNCQESALSENAIYVDFEDRFRGSKTEISDRLKIYLPIIEEAKIGTKDTPVLDLGCGRGEWLELLQEAGYVAKGIDINSILIEQSVSKGLEAIEADAIVYLQSLPNESLGAVTGFHIIEHLPLAILIGLLRETYRVLKPGGIAIFETPNPKNLVVGACNFYSDPTHINPIFPETIQFFLQNQGLDDVQILYLNPVDDSPFKQIDAKWDILDNWFFGPRDYAVIGHKV